MIKSAGNELALQEFTILPFGAANLKKAMCFGVEVHQNLKNIIMKKMGKMPPTWGMETSLLLIS